MVARYWWTLHLYLTLIASAHPNSFVWYVFNTQQTWIFHLHFLKNYMLTFWQLYWHQLKCLTSPLDVFRVLLLAHLAEEFIEIVVRQPLNLILLDFRLIPPLQTIKVNLSTWTWTFARTAQELAWLFCFLHHTILTLTLFMPLVNNYPLRGIQYRINHHDFVLYFSFLLVSLPVDWCNEIFLLPNPQKTTLSFILSTFT